MTSAPAPGAGVGREMSHEASGPQRAGEQPEPLLDVLRRRYATGEISRDQLEEMKRVLGLSSVETEVVGGSHAHAWEGS